MRNRVWLVVLAVVLAFGVITPASAFADSNTPTPTPAVPCSVGSDAAGNVVVTCGPGQSWPTDVQVGSCFDKQLLADGQTVVVTCTPPGVEPPPLPVPPTPAPVVPCSVGTDAASNVVVSCGPGESWPGNVQIGTCFDKQLQADGQTVVVTCSPGTPSIAAKRLPMLAGVSIAKSVGELGARKAGVATK